MTTRTTRLLVAMTAALAAAALSGCVGATSSSSGDTSGFPRSSSASSSAPIAVGKSTRTLEVDGTAREYRVYRPADLPAAAPLVMVLHGAFDTAEVPEESFGWDAVADSQHFVVVYPSGVDRVWNVGGGCCDVSSGPKVDDVAFLSAVVGDVKSALPIDAKRVFAAGFSNGGMMAYRLACDTNLFAAIGPDSATLLGDCPSPRPISVIAIHGTADRTVPYDGGPLGGDASIVGASAPSLNQKWREVDSCGAPAVTTAGPVTTSRATCLDGRAVELITIDGFGHQWPGPSKGTEGGDDPYPGLSATQVMWSFFAAHPAA